MNDLDISECTFEACVESYEEAVRAKELGANRIELCSRLDLDGLTPTRKTILDVKNYVNLPIKIMIRPRGGDFIYTINEIKKMESEIDFCKENGLNEIVLGVLTNVKEIDFNLLMRLVERSHPMGITFHKAIDQTDDIFQQIELLCETTPVESVLTSGGVGTLMKNKKIVKGLLDRFSSKINLILAGSITKNNFKIIHNQFHASEYHGRKIVGDLNL